jgi:hypothetical protein
VGAGSGAQGGVPSKGSDGHGGRDNKFEPSHVSKSEHEKNPQEKKSKKKLKNP